MTAILAYGYKRSSDNLSPLGAGPRVYVDHDSKRRERGRLLGDLRPGDVVRVLYIRDLGGAPVPDRQWIERIEAAGGTVEEHRPVRAPRRMGRPLRIPDDPETLDRLRVVWLDPTRSLADRLQAVADILGYTVTRQALYHRLGSPDKPK